MGKPFKRPRINYFPLLKSQNWELGSKNPWNKMNSMSQLHQAQLSKKNLLIDSRIPVQRIFTLKILIFCSKGIIHKKKMIIFDTFGYFSHFWLFGSFLVNLFIFVHFGSL